MLTTSIVLFIIYVAVSIVLSTVRQSAESKRILWRQTRDFEEIFKNPQIKLPSLKFDTSYGWPSFSITFATKEDMEFAESRGLIAEFKERIKTYYEKEFDSDRAVFCTYVGYVPRWRMPDGETEKRQDG